MWAPAEMKVAHMDPRKAKQAERLGMGLGRAKYENKAITLFVNLHDRYHALLCSAWYFV